MHTGDENILKNLTFFKDANYHSGRASIAMVNLIKNLRLIKSIKVLCFDIPNNYTENDRESQMAKNLWQALKGLDKTLLALTGNIHSRLTVGTPWDPSFPTMGSELLKVSNGKINLNNSDNYLFRIGLGKFWMCISMDNETKCNEFKTGSPSSPYATDVKYESYFINEEEIIDGHKNSIFFRKTSASFPYM